MNEKVKAKLDEVAENAWLSARSDYWGDTCAAGGLIKVQEHEPDRGHTGLKIVSDAEFNDAVLLRALELLDRAMDANEGDVVVQLAAFGRVKYG